MNTNCIVDHEGYSTIKGVEHYMLCNDGLYHGNEKDPKDSWKRIVNPYEVKLEDICEVRDFLEAFDFYPDPENDYLFFYDHSKDNAGTEFIDAEHKIENFNSVYVAVEHPKTKKFMIIPCTDCYHEVDDEPDPFDSEYEYKEYMKNVPIINPVESTKRDITDDIVAYDNKTCSCVIFVGISDVYPYYEANCTGIHEVERIVDKFKIEHIADFKYRDTIDLYETIAHWFSEESTIQPKKVKSKNKSNEYTVVTYGMIDITPNAEDKKVTLTRTFISDTKKGEKSVFYISYKNPGDEYLTMYQVNPGYTFKKLIGYFNAMESLKEEEIE